MLKPDHPRHPLPPMPEIGYPESYYARQVHRADRAGDVHAREAFKVGQYVTLALDPALLWPQKLRYFLHALRRHCNPPPIPDEKVWLFYRELAHLVREHCGREALRLASAEDDRYADRLRLGSTRERIAPDARRFFFALMARSTPLGSPAADQHDVCPEQFTEEDWAQLKILRDQWVNGDQDGSRRPARAGEVSL